MTESYDANSDGGVFEDDALLPLAGRRGSNDNGDDVERLRPKVASAFLGRTLSLRATLVGIAIGILVCLSNVYFGLQNGHGNTQAMVCALLGFGIFQAAKPCLRTPLSPQENALIQTVAAAVGGMPGTAGMVGIVPALEFLVGPSEGGPISLSWFRLAVFSLGLAFFGVIFAMLLRRQYIHGEKLPFPSAIASAVLIDTLHNTKGGGFGFQKDAPDAESRVNEDHVLEAAEDGEAEPEQEATFTRRNTLQFVGVFLASGVIAIFGLIWPILHEVPFLGSRLARDWMWTINISPGIFGQGMVTGPVIPFHMLAGTIVGWAILAPVAKSKGWAPGPVQDWGSGSRGWILWPSLASLLCDSIVNLIWMLMNLPAVQKRAKSALSKAHPTMKRISPKLAAFASPFIEGAAESQEEPEQRRQTTSRGITAKSTPGDLNLALGEAVSASVTISNQLLWFALLGCTLFCMGTLEFVFNMRVPLLATLLSIVLALLLSIMSVRALGQTDFIPVSGLGKIAQFVFAIVISRSNPDRIIINLLAGAIAEAGAMQAAVLIFDLKTGAQLGANPLGQMTGHLAGSFVGALASAAFYKLYARTSRIPGPVFQIPTAYIWLYAARLAYGAGLPEKSLGFSIGFAVFFTLSTAVKLCWPGYRWINVLPGGVAFAIGMYNSPSVILPRVVGGITTWLCLSRWKMELNSLRLIAGALVLGESLFSLLGFLF